MKRKNLISISVVIILLVVIGIGLWSFFTPNNFIANAYNNKFATDKTPDPYRTEFWGKYIFPLILYTILATVLSVLWKLMIRAMKKTVQPEIVTLVKMIGDIIIIPFFIVAYLNQFEAFKGTLIGITALIGTAIGFASSTTIGNFLAGIYLIISRPFGIEDYIIIPSKNVEGVVEEVTVNYTKILQPNRNVAIIPNNEMLKAYFITTKTVIDTENNSGLKKLIDKGKTCYTYPLQWKTSASRAIDTCEKAIAQTIEQYKEQIIESSWGLLSTSAGDRIYQINIIVEDSKLLLSLKGEFLKALEENYQQISSK